MSAVNEAFCKTMKLTSNDVNQAINVVTVFLPFNVLIIAKTVVKTVKTVFILVIKVHLRLKRKKKVI